MELVIDLKLKSDWVGSVVEDGAVCRYGSMG